MTFFFARTMVLSVAVAVLTALPSAAQTHNLPPPPPQTGTQTAPQTQQPQGQVIFSRSTDESGQTTIRGQSAARQATQLAAAPSAEDAERQAVTFTDFDLDVRLRSAAQQIAIRALVAVRNDGKTQLARIPLQISSSLNWERIRVNGKDVTFPVSTLNSDADHTGQLHEAAVPLSVPPG